jgi:AcrR family transcriptional regulator
MVAPFKDGRLRARFRVAVHDSLLEAAERAIVEDGVESASLLSIAKRAGVAVGTIYNYFHDRQELFHELFMKRKSELISEVDAAMKTWASAGFEEQLTSFATLLLSHWDSRREFMRVVLASEPLRLQMMCDKSGRLRSMNNELQARVERVMRVGVREKRVREQEVALLATVFMSILRGVLLARIDDKGNLADSAPRAVQMFCHGAVR